MNSDDHRRSDMAELALRMPAPAERNLPAGRQQALKEHLVSEIRLAGRPSVAKPAPTRRVKPAIIIAAATAAAVAAAAITLAVLPGNSSGASPAAAALLAKIAYAAEQQPVPRVRDSQFSYIKSWVASSVCNGATGKCALEKPHEGQIWQSVSNLCVTGLLREDGQDTPLVFSSNYLHCPYRGGVHDPTYRFLQSLPTDPYALLSLIEREMQGQLPRPEEAFTTIGDLLGAAIAPPKVTAALYRAAALIPGVSVVGHAVDAIGRPGVAVGFTFRGIWTQWIFSKQSLQYLGSREISIANGSTFGASAILQRAFVNRPGQVPPGG
jgi:hypothetical protein